MPSAPHVKLAAIDRVELLQIRQVVDGLTCDVSTCGTGCTVPYVAQRTTCKPPTPTGGHALAGRGPSSPMGGGVGRSCFHASTTSATTGSTARTSVAGKLWPVESTSASVRLNPACRSSPGRPGLSCWAPGTHSLPAISGKLRRGLGSLSSMPRQVAADPALFLLDNLSGLHEHQLRD